MAGSVLSDLLLARTGLDPFRPFTRAQARAVGLTDRQLAGPELRRLIVGVYVGAPVPLTPVLLAEAALLVHPAGAVASHTTAARILRAAVPGDPCVHLTVSKHEDRRQRTGVRCHVAALAATDITLSQGVRLTTAARTFVDLAGTLSLVDLVVLGDSLVRRGLTTPELLVSSCRDARGAWAGHARTAAAYVRERVDSPMETRLRMLIVLAGLPEPKVNLDIRDEHGLVVLRFDLSYPEVRLAIEYDGRHHLEHDSQWERDHVRRDEVADRGWRLLTVTSKGIYREPEQTVERVRKALAATGYQGLRRPTDGWRPYFGQ